jgi:hypothetical protein
VTSFLLEEAIYGWIEMRMPSIVIGPPGVGKTFAAKAAALRAIKDGLIKTYEIVTGSKELTADHIFESRLVISSDSSSNFVKQLASMVRKHCEGSLLPVAQHHSSSVRKLWKPGEWLLIILDEATRCTPAFMDAMLPVLNDFQVTIEGETYYAPVLVIMAGNPAGMDATTSAFSHATTSRLYERITMTQPGAAELASVFTIRGVRDDAEEFGIPERFQPSEDHVRLACGVITILWGLPLDRRGMSALSQEALDLIARVERADPALAIKLEALGTLTHFGPDPRKGRRWCTSAMRKAKVEGVPFDIGHRIDTSVNCLCIGGKPTFSEGQEPAKMAELEDLIFEVTSAVLRSDTLRRLILEEGRGATDPTEPASLSRSIADALIVGGRAGEKRLERLIREHHRRLEADDVFDREAKRRHFAEFLGRVSKIDASLTVPEKGSSARALARRQDGMIIGDDGLVDEAVGIFLRELQEGGDLTDRGQATVGILTDLEGRPVPLALAEEVRLAVRRHQAASPFEAEIRNVCRGHEEFRGRIDRVAAVMASAVNQKPGSDIGPILDGIWSSFSPISHEELRATRLLFIDLFNEAFRQSRPPYRERFEELALTLERTQHGMA